MARKVGLVACAVLAVATIAGGIALLTRGGGEERTSVAPPPVRRPPPVLRAVREFGARVPPGRRLTLRASPEGRVLTTVGPRTEFGSPQTFSVAYVKGPWLAVRSSALGNTRLGWVRARRVRLLNRTLSLEVDLSKRELLVHDVGILRRIPVAVGAPDTPTPPGTFYVTDKLPAPSSARTTAAASSRSRAGSRTSRRAGRAATGWRSTAPPRRPGATPSRTAACTRPSPTFAT